MFYLRVEAEVRPTEEVNNVLIAIRNLFDIEKYTLIKEGSPYPLLVAESSTIRSLNKLHKILRQDRILDTARKVLEGGIKGDVLRFKLHKQSAYAGHISFVHTETESPMGPLTVYLKCSKIQELVDWLAPKTVGGKPLWEKQPPNVD